MRKRLAIIIGALLILLVIGGCVLWMQNPRLTAYVNGPEFKKELDKQTSKGLHFKGQYQEIKRTGFFTAESPRFQADAGIKAMESMDAKEITATFNPLGVFLRRWQLDSVHIRSGEIEIQTYEPQPPEKKQKPWHAFIMPDRVYLREVVCDSANVTWKVRKEKAGFFDTRLLITPHGRDFEYRASGGEFRMKPAPAMSVDELHMLITKEKLSLYVLKLNPTPKSSIRVTGEAGLKGDKTTTAQAEFENVPIRPWIPASWGKGVTGTATGEIEWKGPDQKVESSSGHGFVTLKGARLIGIPMLDYLASAARNEELKELDFSECKVEFSWQYPNIKVRDIQIEAEDNFRIQGSFEIDGEKISGTLDFGVSEKSIEWLPKAKEEIFTRSRGNYLWTKVELSGTLDKPQNDLVPRMADALKRSPGVSAGLFFRQVGEWIQQKTGGD